MIDKRKSCGGTEAHPTMQFNQFVMVPYIGDGSPMAQKMWVDELDVRTGPREGAVIGSD